MKMKYHQTLYICALIVLGLALTHLVGCGAKASGEFIRALPAGDGRPCYVLYQGDEIRGFSCVQE